MLMKIAGCTLCGTEGDRKRRKEIRGGEIRWYLKIDTVPPSP